MTAALWTPGPWTTEGSEEVYGIAIAPPASESHKWDWNTLAAVAVDDDGVGEANARLIALAPEMAALLGVFDRYRPTLMSAFGSHFPSLSRPLDDAHKLLVRARG